MGGSRFVAFELSVGETDLWIGLDPHTAAQQESIRSILTHHVRKLRNEIIAFSNKFPSFLSSHTPIQDIKLREEAAKNGFLCSMIKASDLSGTGPMAAVAGAIAAEVGTLCLNQFSAKEVVVENGGDVFLSLAEEGTISVVSPNSPLSGKLAVVIPANYTPCGICTSSGTAGHSFSYGRADAAMVACRSAALADAWATQLGNRIKTEADAEVAVAFVGEQDEVLSAVAIIGKTLAVCGTFEVRA